MRETKPAPEGSVGTGEPRRGRSLGVEDAQDPSEQMAELAPRTPERRAAPGRMQFRILGPVEVAQGDRTLSLGGPRQRAVLAALLLRANELISTDSLAEAIWGNELPGSARTTLYAYVSRLRAVLGRDRIQSQAPGYRLQLDPAELDAARFDQLLRDAERAKAINPRLAAAVLDEALGLWRGPALADVAEDGAMLAEATRLDELRLRASEERIEALLATGEESRVILEAEALVDRDPLRERIWAQLMLALYREGRQAEALNEFQRVREILADELGIDPSPELVRLHERILKQDPGLELRGEPLRGYRLLEKIDEGPTGVVFRAIQPHVGRDVAVKIIHDRLASDPAFVRRFERDAQAVAALEHPRIVPLYDYWREPGRAYVVSRYLKEGSLRGLESRGERLDRALLVIEQVATALAFAHMRQVLHGNVGASNVLVDGEGNAYLGDFRIGVGFTRKAAEDDVRGLASLAQSLLGQDEMPRMLAELIDRVAVGSESVSASEIAAAAGTGAQEQAVVAPPEAEVRNPYKGLRAFTEADAQDFFGRGELTTRLLSRLAKGGKDSRVLALVGPSGGGKSSVVRAGLVPAIRGGAIGDPERVFVAEMFPGQHPIDELEAALLRISAHSTSRLPDLLDQGSRGLLDAMDLVLPATAELVLVVDQFEEVFTLTSDEHEREVFLESLRVAIADPESRLRLIVTLRADFYDRPLVYPRFGEVLAAATEVVAPLTPDETEQTIRRPAEGVGVSVEPGLLAEIIADVTHQPGALPLLQYGLTELFERRDGDRLTLAAYHEIGGVAGALSARAERIFEATSREGKRTTKQVFLRLVTLGEGREDTRRRVTRSELCVLEVDTRLVDRVIDMFGRHRLLTFDREPSTREPTVEIAHEALLGAWERLRTWIDGARDDLRQDRRLARAAGEWRGSDRDPSFLVREARLEQLEAWASSTDLAIGLPEREYLQASVRVREKERAEEEARVARERELERRSLRRTRGLVAVLTAAALVAATLTLVSVDQRRRAERASTMARDAETAQLAQRLGAQALVEEDLDLSLLLARQAVAIDDSPQTRGYLLKALQRSPEAIAIMRVGQGRAFADLLTAATISPDGKTLAVMSYGLGLLLFDTSTYQQIGESMLDYRPGTEGSLAYSPDGETIAIGGDNVRLVDARTGELLAEATVHETAERMLFSHDGSRLVILDDGGITIRDAATLRLIGPSIEPEALGGGYVGFTFAAPHFAITPDDRSLVTASEDGELAWWDLRSGEKTRTLSIETGQHALALSPDGRTAAVGVRGGIQLVDLASGTVRTATGFLSGWPNWLLFSPEDADTVVSTNFDGTVTVWDVGLATPRETLRGHSNTVEQPVFSPDGQTLYAVGHDGTAIAWDMTGERGLARPFTFTRDRPSSIFAEGWEGHPGEFSPDGRRFAVGLQDRGIALRDARELTQVGALLETGGNVNSLDFSPDGSLLAAAAGDQGIITVWDVRSGFRLLREALDDVDGLVVGLEFSPDGRTLAATTGREVRLLDVATGDSLREIGSEQCKPRQKKYSCAAFDPAFSTDGTMIATARGLFGGADVWDLATGASIATVDALPNDDPNDLVALSPDGGTLAVGGWDSVVRLVDVRTGELFHQLDLGGTGAFTLEFSPDGRTLAVSGWDAVASLWDVATGTQIGPRLTAGSRRTSLDVSSDGRHLLMTSSNGVGAIRDIDPEIWKERACTIANRTLTPEEWEQFLPGLPYEPTCR